MSDTILRLLLALWRPLAALLGIEPERFKLVQVVPGSAVVDYQIVQQLGLSTATIPEHVFNATWEPLNDTAAGNSSAAAGRSSSTAPDLSLRSDAVGTSSCLATACTCGSSSGSAFLGVAAACCSAAAASAANAATTAAAIEH